MIVRTPDLPQVLKTMPRVKSFSNVVNILGDQTDLMYSFFRDGSGKDDARTVAVGKSTVNTNFTFIHGYNNAGIFLTPLGATGGEFAPRMLSFFLEFWVLSLIFEFFP